MTGNAREPKLPGSGLFISEYVEQVRDCDHIEELIYMLDARFAVDLGDDYYSLPVEKLQLCYMLRILERQDSDDVPTLWARKPLGVGQVIFFLDTRQE